jgi:methyl coenzyme M reductase subunit D
VALNRFCQYTHLSGEAFRQYIENVTKDMFPLGRQCRVGSFQKKELTKEDVETDDLLTQVVIMQVFIAC